MLSRLLGLCGCTPELVLHRPLVARTPKVAAASEKSPIAYKQDLLEEPAPSSKKTLGISGFFASPMLRLPKRQFDSFGGVEY